MTVTKEEIVPVIFLSHLIACWSVLYFIIYIHLSKKKLILLMYEAWS